MSGPDRSETVFNIGIGFVQNKVLLPLVECDGYETIAQHGSLNIDDNLRLDPQIVINNRIEAIYRLKNKLMQVLQSSSFVIRKRQRKNFENIREDLIKIANRMDAIYYEEHNEIAHTKRVVINERYFNFALDKLKSIKERLNGPLNKSNLIFWESDEMNLEDIKRGIMGG